MLGPAGALAMPFLDDDLLWCPDSDGRMVDLSCLQVIIPRAAERGFIGRDKLPGPGFVKGPAMAVPNKY